MLRTDGAARAGLGASLGGRYAPHLEALDQFTALLDQFLAEA